MRRLKRLRRRWCEWRGHEFVKHELCMSYKANDRLLPGGTIEPGDETEVWSMRCARHG